MEVSEKIGWNICQLRYKIVLVYTACEEREGCGQIRNVCRKRIRIFYIFRSSIHKKSINNKINKKEIIILQKIINVIEML